MSKFVASAPKLPKSFQSGQFLGGTLNKPNIDNLVGGFGGSTFTSNIIGSQTIYPFLNNEVSTTEGVYTAFTSNAMINTDNFNIIKLDLGSVGDYKVKVSALYSHTNDIRDSYIKYSTIIEANQPFYRNYPVENNFFQLALTKVEGGDDTHQIIKGDINLTKFTEFNTPSQLSDTINRFNMSLINRQGNEYIDDVLIGRLDDVKKTSRVGICDSITVLKQNVWNFNGNEDFSNLTNTACVIRSSSVSDIGLKVRVKGWSGDVSTQLEEEIVELDGTSNIGIITEFKAISDMRILGADQTAGVYTNTGEVEIYRFGTNELLSQMEKGYGRQSSLQYICPPSYKSVIKQLQVNGRTAYNLESKLSLYRVEGEYGNKELIYQNNMFDSEINNEVNLDIGLNPLDIVYGVIDSSNIGIPDMGDSQYSIRMNIIEYPTKTNSIL